MTLLYPRLLRQRAKKLATDYKTLSLHDVSRYWAVRDESAVFVATGGTRVDGQKLSALRRDVVDLAEKSGFPTSPDATQKTEFDLSLAVLLHRQMDIAPAEAAAGDVWAFLALVVLPDVSHWRYPNPPGDRVLGTDLTRHVLAKMWWRAHLVYSSDGPDPYAALEVLGEAAFDQIYARRAALGGSPHLIRAILRVWRRMDLSGLNERATLRDFLKRLLRLAPFVMFEALDESALDEELVEIAQETITGRLVVEFDLSRGEARTRAMKVFSDSEAHLPAG